MGFHVDGHRCNDDLGFIFIETYSKGGDYFMGFPCFLALLCVQSYAIVVLDALNMETPKTSAFIGVLKNLNIADRKALVLVGEKNANVYLSSRNIQGASVQMANTVSTYDIMNCTHLVFV